MGTIIAITSDTEVTQALTENEHGTIITDTTPFYATMGGQQADKGVIVGETGEFVVEDTIKLQGDKIGHIGYVRKGMLIVDEVVSLKVDVNRRKEIAKNHSATHLLHKALRLVLGTHVEQAGSLVDEDRLRFDFTHFAALTQEEIKKIEDIVNEEILAAIPVTTEVMKLSDAKKSGAMALFGEKYKDDVRVVSMADFSKELCGGTHVENTADIQNFKIISESGIAAGVRRIEALTSKGLLNYYENLENAFSEVAKELKSTMFESGDRVKSLLEEVKHLKSENEKLKAKLANNALSDANESTFEIKNVKLILMKVEGIEINELRNLGDKLKNETNGGVVVLASVVDSKVNLLVMAGDEAIKKGVHAGNIIKNIAKLVGGGGGGRPNMAQAGGTNPSGIDDAFELAKKVLEEQIA